MAERIQYRSGRTLPKGAVYIGRNRRGIDPYGNPFALGRPHPFDPDQGIITDRAHGVALHTQWLPTQPARCARIVSELRGCDLACWCPLDGGPCHGNLLLALANTPIGALTVQQPWAWAIAYAGKRVENRTWAPPEAAIGHLLAIHAGQRWWPRWQDEPLIHHAWAAFAAERARNGVSLGRPGSGVPYCDEGAMVAVATFAGAHVAANGCCAPWGQPSFFDPQRGWVDVYHWLVRDVRPLVDVDQPQPLREELVCSGRQRIWTPQPVTRAALIGAIQ
ncbi:DUF4326 domain-containing protein [Micromonospora sp. NPDC049662]|uniref:DUF4326 domain-containing protein n=1 Tax=Micromonospora sp. NPDC049662 TaxID=3155397 RepID=UPI00344223E8